MQELPPFDEQDTLGISTGTWLVMVAIVLALFCTVIFLTFAL